MRKVFALFIFCFFLSLSCFGGGGGSNNNPAKSGEKTITSFVFSKADNSSLTADVTGIISGTGISATVPNGTNQKSLVPAISVMEGATVSPESGVAQDFSGQVSYTVTAGDGSTQNYTVSVTDTSGAILQSLGFPGAPGETATVTIAGGTNSDGIYNVFRGKESFWGLYESLNPDYESYDMTFLIFKDGYSVEFKKIGNVYYITNVKAYTYNSATNAFTREGTALNTTFSNILGSDDYALEYFNASDVEWCREVYTKQPGFSGTVKYYTTNFELQKDINADLRTGTATVNVTITYNGTKLVSNNHPITVQLIGSTVGDWDEAAMREAIFSLDSNMQGSLSFTNVPAGTYWLLMTYQTLDYEKEYVNFDSGDSYAFYNNSFCANDDCGSPTSPTVITVIDGSTINVTDASFDDSHIRDGIVTGNQHTSFSDLAVTSAINGTGTVNVSLDVVEANGGIGGISTVQVTLASPKGIQSGWWIWSTGQYIQFTLTKGSGNSWSYTGLNNINDFNESGTWYVERIHISGSGGAWVDYAMFFGDDKLLFLPNYSYQESSGVWMEDSSVPVKSFTHAGTSPDTTTPILVSLSAVQATQTTANDSYKITLTVSDTGGSGITTTMNAHLNMFHSTDTNYFQGSVNKSLASTGIPGVFEAIFYKNTLQYGAYTIGSYEVRDIQFQDNAGNISRYFNYPYYNSGYYTYYNYYTTITTTSVPAVTLVR